MDQPDNDDVADIELFCEGYNTWFFFSRASPICSEIFLFYNWETGAAGLVALFFQPNLKFDTSKCFFSKRTHRSCILGSQILLTFITR